MSRIKGKDTKPELVLRRGLHARGFRFRLHAKELPGRPDLVFPRWRTIAFVHGCFWHGHSRPMFKLPSTRPAFWRSKISGNRDRDHRAVQALKAAGWRVLVVWDMRIAGAGTPSRRRGSGSVRGLSAGRASYESGPDGRMANARYDRCLESVLLRERKLQSVISQASPWAKCFGTSM
jgi:DNA mismatch endonuclease (patch repair protein)